MNITASKKVDKLHDIISYILLVFGQETGKSKYMAQSRDGSHKEFCGMLKSKVQLNAKSMI